MSEKHAGCVCEVKYTAFGRTVKRGEEGLPFRWAIIPQTRRVFGSRRDIRQVVAALEEKIVAEARLVAANDLREDPERIVTYIGGINALSVSLISAVDDTFMQPVAQPIEAVAP